MSKMDQTVRSRILAATKAELALHGIAGARIARIATRAQTSKERIYAYFRTKAELFEEVYLLRATDLARMTSIGEEGLPEFVGNLFDYYVANPEDLRLARWMGLEELKTHPRLYEANVQMLQRIAEDIATLKSLGAVDPAWPPLDLFVMLVNIALAWPTAPDIVRQLSDGAADPVDLATHRRLAVEAARRLSEPRG